MSPDLTLEARVDGPVCGIDEAGRGPWAGPVIAAAVILDQRALPEGANDSKLLSPKRRAALFDVIVAEAEVGIGRAEVVEIDEIGVGRATDRAMCRALDALPRRPGHALVDGIRVPLALGCPASGYVKGDRRSLSIAAASIIAKVTRDREMVALAQQYPGYGWETNMGYGVPAHIRALDRLGVTPHHRRSFRPIHNILYQENSISP
ncbi:MAG: ribonuclease HII [Pseudomonadota bacterium]